MGLGLYAHGVFKIINLPTSTYFEEVLVLERVGGIMLQCTSIRNTETHFSLSELKFSLD